MKCFFLFCIANEMFFLFPNLGEQRGSGGSPFAVSWYLFWFQSCGGLGMSGFGSGSAREGCRGRSESVEFVASCAGHVGGVKE